MRIMLVFAFLSFSTFFYSQELEEDQINKIQGFGIDYPSQLKKHADLNVDLNHILNLERKRKKNKTFGIILGGLGLLTSAYGISAFTRDEANPYTVLAGGALTGIGLAEMGISISLLKSSKKRTKERDTLIKKYNENWSVEK